MRPGRARGPDGRARARAGTRAPEVRRDWLPERAHESQRGPLEIASVQLSPCTVTQLRIPLSEVAIRAPVPVHVTVVRGAAPGPRLFLTAGVHGDELNGVAIVREVSQRLDPRRLSGDVICVPIVNVPGFLNRSRYLPDGTDPNRFFPGAPGGKPAERLAHELVREIVSRCDYGIDFHTAARGRANIPHVRADMDRPDARTVARAFGTAIVVHKLGHARSLRRAATEAGVPTIVLEAGQTGLLQRRVREAGVRGVRNVLRRLGMLPGEPRPPPFQVIVRDSVWIRARQGGLCELSVGPGELVYEGAKIGVNRDPFGPGSEPILAPITGLVIGVSLDPVCEPGYPLCHVVRLKKTLRTVERHLRERSRSS